MVSKAPPKAPVAFDTVTVVAVSVTPLVAIMILGSEYFVETTK
jgi:hypothetical protein